MIDWIYNILIGKYYLPIHHIVTRLFEKKEATTESEMIQMLEYSKQAKEWKKIPLEKMVTHLREIYGEFEKHKKALQRALQKKWKYPSTGVGGSTIWNHLFGMVFK